MNGTWCILLPVKGGPAAKSRLAAAGAAATGIPAPQHAALAEAIALDTIEAVLGCPRVASAVVVTAEAAIGARAVALGATVVAEHRAGAGLNRALHDGLRDPSVSGHDGGVAVLLADLPALRPDQLSDALDAAAAALRAGPPMVAVPDAEGRGTVLLAALRAGCLDPAFGRESLAAHRSRGAAVLEVDLPGLRRDVDTVAGLELALALGCGPRTVALATAGGPAAASRPARGYPGLVQATVHRFDPVSGAGSVLTDNGTVLPFTAEAFAGSGLRLVRVGQRLTVVVEGQGAEALVTGLKLETVGRVPTRPARP